VSRGPAVLVYWEARASSGKNRAARRLALLIAAIWGQGDISCGNARFRNLVARRLSPV
jgi:hypothetical protein